MSELGKKVQKSIERFKAFEPPEGYYLAFSGGKDSVVIKALAGMAGVKYDAHYNLTSVDPPELVRFIRDKHPDVQRNIPRYDDGRQITMWNLIPQKLMPPTRRLRYCCAKLKESSGEGRIVVTGVRWAESSNRKENQDLVSIRSPKTQSHRLMDAVGPETGKINRHGGLMLNSDNDTARRMVEQCYTKHKTIVNPIVDWTNEDVWQFIRSERCNYCELYDDGWERLGCVGCPMAGKHGRERGFLRWPKFKRAYIRAFDAMLEERKRRCLNTQWTSGTDVFRWWMEYDTLPGQMDLLEDYEGI